MEMLIKEFFLLTVLTLLFVVERKHRKPAEQRLPVEPLQEQIATALALARAADATNAQTPNRAADESLAALEERGVKLDRTLTESEADHLLGLFQPPSARQADILKHFRIPRTREMNRTLANLAIQNLFADPANVEEWNQRPPTSRIRQGILFMSGQLISGMTQVEAQSKLMQYGMENPLKYSEWKHIEKLFVAVNDPVTLQCHDARKITWKRFFQLYDAIKASGVNYRDIDAASILRQGANRETEARNGDAQLGLDGMATTLS